jgi:hypothetical protein
MQHGMSGLRPHRRTRRAARLVEHAVAAGALAALGDLHDEAVHLADGVLEVAVQATQQLAAQRQRQRRGAQRRRGPPPQLAPAPPRNACLSGLFCLPSPLVHLVQHSA